jgi:hypothetical protein
MYSGFYRTVFAHFPLRIARKEFTTIEDNGMKKALLVMITGLLATAVAMPLLADKVVKPRPGPVGSWRLIGQVHADHSRDHDTIVVRGPYDNFRRIKIRVTDAPLDITRMVVTYDNGRPDVIAIRHTIRRGGESRAIDLRGAGKRSLRKVEFWYDTKGWLQGKADVTLYGMK